MNFVHSFWSKPLLNNKFNNFDELLPVVLIDYAYSVSCIHRHGHSIKLFTDKKGAELLSFLPYDEVIIIDNLDESSIHFAAQIKFEALSRMSLDEILIDGDLFLRKPDVFELVRGMNQDFVYSFYEPNSFILSSEKQIDKYSRMFTILLQHYDEFNNDIYNLDDTIYDYSWPNTSLMKFSNQKLKDEYIKQYHRFYNILKNDNFRDTWPDIIIEQRHMDKLLKHNTYSSSPVVEDFPTDKANNSAISIGFVHLGAGKIFYHDVVCEWFRDEDPELYRRTLKQIETYQKRDV